MSDGGEDGALYVARLRAAVGTAPLWLSSVTAVVLDSAGSRTLLVRRDLTGLWAPPAAVLGPGAVPARVAAEAVHEDAGAQAEAEAIVGVQATREITYADGSRASYVNLVMRMRSRDDAHSAHARWFPVDSLPERMGADHRERVAMAVAPPERIV